MKKEKKNFKRLMTIMITATMCIVILPPVNADYPTEMVAYWKFDEGSETTVYNSAGTIDGTVNGATYTTGIVSNALSFNGVDSYVTMGSTTGTVLDFGTGESFTIEFWIKTTQAPADPHELVGIYSGLTNPTPDQFYMVSLAEYGKIRGYIRVNNAAKNNILMSNVYVNDGYWHHIVFIKDVSTLTMKIFIDGNIQGTLTEITDGETTNNYEMHIGNGHWNRHYNGLLDEIAIYNSALSEDEIDYHYCLGYNFGHGYFDSPTLEYTGAPQPKDSVTLEATLTDSTGVGMSGYTVEFYLDGESVGTAVTGDDGIATKNIGTKPVEIYQVTASVFCLESDTAYLAVYDPDAGFVTGGGWINSPEGAYPADPDLVGKAHFGFISKYKKGQQNPTGNTEFQFQMANLNFHSSQYDWLVVAGAKAMYKGTGTLNGAGNYGFILSAIDGQINGGGNVDKFRIKIWDKDNNDEIIYDNQLNDPEDNDPTTAIAGGQIVIHKK